MEKFISQFDQTDILEKLFVENIKLNAVVKVCAFICNDLLNKKGISQKKIDSLFIEKYKQNVTDVIDSQNVFTKEFKEQLKKELGGIL